MSETSVGTDLYESLNLSYASKRTANLQDKSLRTNNYKSINNVLQAHKLGRTAKLYSWPWL